MKLDQNAINRWCIQNKKSMSQLSYEVFNNTSKIFELLEAKYIHWRTAAKIAEKMGVQTQTIRLMPMEKKNPNLVKINWDMVDRYCDDNGLNMVQMSEIIYGSGHINSLGSARQSTANTLFVAKKIADAIGVTVEELTDQRRMVTSTGKVLYKEAVPLPKKPKEPGEVKEFLRECCDRADKTKTDLDRVYRLYLWWCEKEGTKPKTLSDFIMAAKSCGVYVFREYGRAYGTHCKPFKNIELRAGAEEDVNKAKTEEPKKEEPQMVEQKVEERKEENAGKKTYAYNAADVLNRLNDFLMRLYYEDVDKVDVLDVLKFIREAKHGRMGNWKAL